MESKDASPKSTPPKRNSESEEDGEVSKKPCVASLFRGDSSPSWGSQSSTLHPRYTEDFDERELLGKGGYGVVYQCKHRLDQSMYAVKKIPFNDQERERALREVRNLAALQHPGVIRYYQCWIEEGKPDIGSSSEDEIILEATKTLFVVMELCGSTLHDKLNDKTKKVEMEVAWRYFKDLLEGLKFIHGRGFIHGDISRDNIFLDAHDQAKLGDFGLSRSSGDDTLKSLGNEMYRAPELSLGASAISSSSDMFALGLVLFEMSHFMETEVERVRNFDYLKKHGKVPSEETALEMIPSIIGQLIKEDPIQRPSAAQLLQDYFP